ncbi:MAG: SDR family NAD(P)-dependent oxidoreductase [Gammaproteobacteria bacterium]|nr:SDR family NAD(P)-dependent oxidoreductase [Gammaproteobacteria bacterium]
MLNLKDKVVLITGASSGIGRATAKLFARHHAKVIACARREDKLITLAEEIKRENQHNIEYFVLDVRKRESVQTALDDLLRKEQHIDILVNNAGLSQGLDAIQNGDIDDWERMIDTNIKGLLYVTRAIIPSMVTREQGHIINIGSISGHEVYPNGGVYCSTKFAVNALTKGLRYDLSGTGVKVSTIDPGMLDTEFSIVRFHGDERRANEVYKGMTPLKAEDVADAILYCATRPKHVNIDEMILTPLDQVSTQIINRKK